MLNHYHVQDLQKNNAQRHFSEKLKFWKDVTPTSFVDDSLSREIVVHQESFKNRKLGNKSNLWNKTKQPIFFIILTIFTSSLASLQILGGSANPILKRDGDEFNLDSFDDINSQNTMDSQQNIADTLFLKEPSQVLASGADFTPLNTDISFDSILSDNMSNKLDQSAGKDLSQENSAKGQLDLVSFNTQDPDPTISNENSSPLLEGKDLIASRGDWSNQNPDPALNDVFSIVASPYATKYPLPEKPQNPTSDNIWGPQPSLQQLKYYALVMNLPSCPQIVQASQYSTKIRGLVKRDPERGETLINFVGDEKLLDQYIHAKDRSIEYSSGSGMLVHQDIYEDFNVIRNEFLNDMKQYLAIQGRIVFLGWSLGGAYAILAALALVEQAQPSAKISVYTFGAPRIGNSRFSNFIQSKLEVWRTTNMYDQVTVYPMYSQNPGVEIWISKPDGPIYLCPPTTSTESLVQTSSQACTYVMGLWDDFSMDSHNGPYFGQTAGICGVK
ncbi:hypothetical protein G9A89_012597 [Geosiphon pyriformis]|nr:hypothetical protein G9A89_012597 [Geosiphon pyriformis]